MKAWLKGGLIGIGLFLVLITSLYATIIFSKDSWAGIGLLLLVYPWIFIVNVKALENFGFLFLGINFLIVFFIGALIGWLVGKFKKPKNIKGGKSIR